MSCVVSLLHLVFDDKRVAIACVITWLCILLFTFYSMGLLHATFITFGPSPHTKIMTMTIDTWSAWSLVAMASFVSTVVSDFFGDSIGPFIMNTIQDHKGIYLPYSKFQCLIITQLWSVYCVLMSVFSLGLMTSQLDFILIRLTADLIVNGFTTYKFMSHKKTDADRYYADYNNSCGAKSVTHIHNHSDGGDDQSIEMSDVTVLKPLNEAFTIESDEEKLMSR